MSEIDTITRLRLAVMFLGERPQHRWWDTSFVNPLGFRYLGLIFPKTSPIAALTAASEAACRIHDERIGRGRVAHLFRLSSEAELRLRSQAGALSVETIQAVCSNDAALDLLDTLAGDTEALSGAGPIRSGGLKDLDTPGGLARMAATYASGFRSGTHVFPYFA